MVPHSREFFPYEAELLLHASFSNGGLVHYKDSDLNTLRKYLE